ncbi:MAG TPA: DUF3365 domain-containing protein [Cryomorphaceae bacterium]|nr:DUF3365 domain-containing protein [Cryomorphaceae bacterium]
MQNSYTVVFFLGILFCSVSCSDLERKNRDAQSVTENHESKDLKGLSLLEQNCFSCHSPNPAGEKNRIAPTIASVKNTYVNHLTTDEVRIAAMVEFLENPTEERALMGEAVEEFGLMSKMELTKSAHKQVATYIFENDIENLEWYLKADGELEETKSSLWGLEDAKYLKIGKNYALQAKAVLGKNLKLAISDKGPHGAVSFCHIEAYPLTDSVGTSVDASIKRVTDRPRNPSNLANDREMEYINSAKSQLNTSGSVSPNLQFIDGKYVGYYPIKTQAMCLICHGEPNKEINPKTLAVLQELYPEDRATGYRANELRGIWVVKMGKE